MRRIGSHSIGEFPFDVVRIECERWGRAGRYLNDGFFSANAETLLLGSLGFREGVGQGQPVCSSKVAPPYERKTMTTYIALFNLTEAGIKAAKDSPRRLDAAKKLLADMGGEMKQFYMVMGEFDFVGICEAPDDAVMARYVLQLGGLGFVRTKTLKAFPETAYREIIRSLG
jgi:uncharacterized protein with GYD domain